MENDDSIKREVEQTMQALDGIERAKPDGFFYTRLEERIKNREESNPVSGKRLVSALSFAIAAVIILILFNILTVLEYEYNYGDTETIHQQNLEAFAEEYQLQLPTIYESNSEE